VSEGGSEGVVGGENNEAWKLKSVRNNEETKRLLYY